MATAQQVEIAHKLYEARRTLRRLLGEKYPALAAKWMATVKQIGEVQGLDELHTCMLVLQREQDGMAQLWVCAATVELIEPDKLTPKLEV